MATTVSPAEEADPKPKIPPPPPPPTKVLSIDIGGSKVKVLVSGQTEPRKMASGNRLTPATMVESVLALVAEWKFDGVSIGYPGLVGSQGPRAEPGNLGPGWVGFDFAAAFGRPVRIINDAAMQALGSYEGGRMLFLGLGTGLGSSLIADRVIVPLELGRLGGKDGKSLGETLGRKGLERLGKSAWREAVRETATSLMAAFVADYIVIGGGNAKLVKDLPPGARLGHNLTAFRGGFRLWNIEDVPTLAANGDPSAPPPPPPPDWRLI